MIAQWLPQKSHNFLTARKLSDKELSTPPHCRVSSSKDIDAFLTTELPPARILMILLCGNYAGSAHAIWHSFLCWAYSNRNLKNSLTVDPPPVRISIISLLWGLLWQGTRHFPHCRVSSSKDINDFLPAEFPSVRILDSSTQLLCTKPRNRLKPHPIIMRELCGICLCYLAFLSVLGLLK